MRYSRVEPSATADEQREPEICRPGRQACALGSRQARTRPTTAREDESRFCHRADVRHLRAAGEQLGLPRNGCRTIKFRQRDSRLAGALHSVVLAPAPGLADDGGAAIGLAASTHLPVPERDRGGPCGRPDRGCGWRSGPRGRRRAPAGQRGEDMAGRVRVEVAGRLVGEQHARSVGDGAGDRDALLLAARQLGRPVRRAARRGRGSRGARRRARAPRLARRPRMSCGITTFSSAENSGSRWWNW